MKISDIKWSTPDRPQFYPWCRLAFVDKAHPVLEGYRNGCPVSLVWWPDTNEYAVEGCSSRLTPLEFAAFLRDYDVQVFLVQ